MKATPEQIQEIYQRILAAKCSYSYCGVCGRVPRENEECNWAPLRWWDPDDGWKIGALCRWCAEDCLLRKPQPGDFAASGTNGVADIIESDEDPGLALWP